MADSCAELMAASNSTEQTLPTRRRFGQWAKQAGLFVLFGTILMIPRLRRLRRRAGAWACVRLGAAWCGVWLVWRHTHAGAGVASLAGGVLLLAFALLVRASPVAKSRDAIAAELNALIVLNGGTFRPSPDSFPVPHAQIFVHVEQIIVLGPGERYLLEIPLAKVRRLAAHPLTKRPGQRWPPWELEINWEADVARTTTFQYEGPFASHLAQIAESTLRRQWIKDLPIIHQ